jgi:uncharacterized protein YecE (DUF72 family)
MTGQIHIGTSGWHYQHWKGPFYPSDISDGEMLAHYAGQLKTVEINNTFYQLPERETIATWRETVGTGFRFAVKANRYITHMKKLKDPEEPVDRFLSRITELGDRLGPILFQLPPNWRFNAARLQSFLEILPAHHRYAFELRDPDWIRPEACHILANHGAAFCIYDFHGRQSPKEVTADFVYVRLHGPHDAYRGRYDAETLSGWAGAFATWERQGKDVYCYFDNDEKGYAAQNALELREMMSRSHR